MDFDQTGMNKLIDDQLNERIKGRVKSCLVCPIRKYYAKVYDMHFDYKDCPARCPYDPIEKKEKKDENRNQEYNN